MMIVQSLYHFLTLREVIPGWFVQDQPTAPTTEVSSLRYKQDVLLNVRSI
jgi:hypothetical protein